MTEPVGEVAGRLQVIVEASTAGFKKKLKAKVEKAAKGIVAEVGVEVDAKKLRKQLQAKVDTAAKGVTVTVGVDVDAKTLRAKVEAAAKAAAATVTVKVDADADALVADTKAAVAAAEAATGGVRVPLRTRALDFVKDVLAARAAGQAAATASGGVEIPVSAGGGRGGFRLRTLFRGGVIFSLLSLIQPAVGAIGQVVAGLTAMTGAAAPAVGVLNAIPVALAAGIQSMVGFKVATQGVGDAMGLLAEKRAALARGEEFSVAQQEKLNQVLGELSPSAAKFAKRVTSLRGAWVKARKEIQEPLFEPIADQIKPLVKSLLPTLTKGLKGTAAAFGDAGGNAATFLQTKDAQADIGQVMETNNFILRDFLYTMGQFGKGSLDILVSSRKFARGFGATMRSVGDWFAGKAAKGRETGGTAAFLETASEKASQLWNILKQIGGGLAGIFRAGTDSGNRLLATFETFVTKWHTWVDSTQGQNYLKDWFAGTETGFIEFSRLVNDTFKGIAKWAADPKIAGMLEQIRTELGPALGDLLKNLGDDAGAGVIDFLTQLTRLLNNLEPAIEVVTMLTEAITGLLDALNDLAEANPGTTSNVAKLLGGLVLMGSVGRLGKIGKALFGISKGAKAANTAAKGGFLARLLGGGGSAGALTKNPLLKKAGLLGLFLTGVDLAQMGYAAFTFGDKQAAALVDGFANGPGTKKARQSVNAAWDKNIGAADGGSWYDAYAPDVAGFIGKMGIDQERLKAEIAKWGTAGSYYKEVMDKLRGEMKSGGALGEMDAGILPWVETDTEEAKNAVSSLEQIGRDADKAIAAAKESRKSVEALYNLLAVPVGLPKLPGPKKPKVPDVKPPLSGNDPFGIFKRPEPPKPPDVKPPLSGNDPFGLFTKKGPQANPFASIYTQGLPKGLKAKLRRQGEEAGRGVPEGIAKGLRTGKGKVDKGFNEVTGGVKRARKPLDEFVTGARKAGKSLDGVAKGSDKVKRSSQGLNRSANALTKIGRAGEKVSRTVKRSFNDMLQGADKVFKGVARNATQGMSKTEKAGREGMRGFVQAVSRSKGPAGTASKGVANATKRPVSNLRGEMSAAGTYAMSGLAAGIRAGGNAAVAEARAVAARVAAATRSEMQIKSPSRVMMRLGKWVSLGFAKGIKGGLKAVEAAQEGLWKRLKDKGESAKRIRDLKQQFGAEFRAIEEAAKKRDRLADKISRVQNRLTRLREGKEAVRSALTSSGDEYGSISAIAEANGGYATPGSLVATLRERFKQTKMFQTVLAKLRKRGLGERAYRQIAELGIEGGLPLAQQLLGGSPKDLKRINRLQNLIAERAKKIAGESVAAYYSSGIKASAGILKGLKKQQKALNKVAEKMGEALVRAVRKALGLKAPAKPGKKPRDDDGPKRPPRGGGGAADRVRAGARQAHRNSSNPGGPPAAGRVRVGSAAASQEFGPGGAPLVGELHLHGMKGDGKETRDLLDETYFTLRRIRQGGLYADRTG